MTPETKANLIEALYKANSELCRSVENGQTESQAAQTEVDSWLVRLLGEDGWKFLAK